MILVILLSFFLLFCPFAHAISIPLGGVAPDFTLNTIDGKAVSLSEYKEKIVVLIYWETGQGRSLLALEDGEDIFRRYKGKGVQVIGLIAEPENQEEIRRIVKKYEIDFPVLLDPNREVYGDYGVRVYPSTVIIDRNGKLAYDIPGHAVTYKITLEAHLQYMLGEIDKGKLEDIISPHKEAKDKSALEAERKYNLALKFTEAGFIEKAIETVKESIEAKRDISKSHILLGFLFLEIKDADKALQEFNSAIGLDPLSHDAKTGLGGALILKGDIDSAIKILTDAVVANPYPQRTYYELGKAYELKGEKDKSIEMYRKSIGKIIKRRILPSMISQCQ
jgi:tetratricopeptide (TPR) repeat protein